MSHWNDFLNNDVLWTAVLAWFIAQTLKCILVYLNNKKSILPNLLHQVVCPVHIHHFVYL